MIIKNFKNSRENIDIKQKDIAEFFNLNFTTISGWETGKDTIPLRRLIEYANHYNFSLDYLFGITNKNDESYLPLEIDIDLISKNLRILRKRNAMTQEEVAKKINTSQANYAHYENSKNLIPTTFLYSLTLVYKPFSIDKLLGRKKQ
ncbi:MAG: helix-turn-helix domain-containing protein [Mollicutes bacterium]|nr:helix-turn-helix domain-containing protein [Mollicutes bacterium]